MKTRNAKLEFFLHLLTGLVLVLKGADKLTQSHLISGSIMLLLALLIFGLVLFGEKLNFSHSKVKRISWLIESLALFIVALVFYQEGRQYLQYVFGTCAIVYFILAIVHFVKHRNSAH